MARPKKTAAKKAPKKSAAQPKPRGQSQAPLPPPVEPEALKNSGENQDDYNGLHLLPMDNQPVSAASVHSSVSSSTSEPDPGEPLNQEQEEILAQEFPEVEEEDAGSAPSLEQPAEMNGIVRFREDYVRDVLEESFEWLAEKFQSDHWALTERQSRMLGAPTAQLLSSLWSHVERLIPTLLGRWADSTPGLMDFVLAAGIVIGPKVTMQIALTRSKKSAKAQPQTGPQRVPRPAQGVGAVGPINMNVEPLQGA